MFAGVPNVGAEDAWYITALEMEHAQLSGIPASGGSADIHKCFDQLSRPLLLSYFAPCRFPAWALGGLQRLPRELGCPQLPRGHVRTALCAKVRHPPGMPVLYDDRSASPTTVDYTAAAPPRPAQDPC
jgi:hypothetical protein